MNNKKILVCDDDVDILSVLSLILTNAGYRVITESNSQQVGALVQQEVPDILLLDLWMPILNGDEVLKDLKAKGLARELPVLFISASPDVAAVVEESGANGYITKPFEITELISKIETTLNS